MIQSPNSVAVYPQKWYQNYREPKSFLESGFQALLSQNGIIYHISKYKEQRSFGSETRFLRLVEHSVRCEPPPGSDRMFV